MGIFGPVAVEDNITSAVPEISNIRSINSKTVTSIIMTTLKNSILWTSEELIEEFLRKPANV